jgi:IS30 family transposase
VGSLAARRVVERDCTIIRDEPFSDTTDLCPRRRASSAAKKTFSTGADQSHEIIYQSRFIQARGALKKELLAYLRRPRAIHCSRHHTQNVLLAKVAGKDTETVIKALIKQAHKLPRELDKSLTWDRGKEMADHQRFTLATDIKVYFCDPQHPWQRGSNENTNGLPRQYFPKGMDLSNVHQNKLNAIARRPNERPRETLDFETPAERFNQCVAATG